MVYDRGGGAEDYKETLSGQGQPGARLVMQQGPWPGRDFVISQAGLLIGRAPDCDVVLDDAEVSRQHARFYWRGAELVVEDLGSRNGTLVNGLPISEPQALHQEDVVGIGASVFAVQALPGLAPAYLPPSAAVPPPAPAEGGGHFWLVVGGLGVLLVAGIVLLILAAAGIWYFTSATPRGQGTVIAATSQVVKIEPTNTPSPNPTDTLAPSTSTPTPLDPCSLVTKAEAEAVLGGPAQNRPPSGFADCTYVLSSGTKYLVVGAAQGDQARDLTLRNDSLMVIFIADEQVRSTFEGMQAKSATLTVKDVVSQSVPFYEGVGYTVEPVAGIGDVAFWAVLHKVNAGVLVVVKGDVYLYVNLAGVEPGPAREAAQNLARQVLGRLPPRFTVPLPSEIRIEVTVALPTVEVQFTTTILLPPAPTPTGTPPPPAPTPKPTGTPPPPAPTPEPAYVEQPSCTADCADCKGEPGGGTCLVFPDNYFWLVNDSVVAWESGETYQGKPVQIARGVKADYYHVLGTLLVKKAPKKP
jgi:hypothetical protein